jgi:hypothetical protein
MTEPAFNLLTHPLSHAAPLGYLSLPGLMAALARAPPTRSRAFPPCAPTRGRPGTCS